MPNTNQTLAELFGLDQNVVKANSDKASWSAWEKLNAWVQSLSSDQYKQLQLQVQAGVGWDPIGNDNGGVTTQSLLHLEQSLQKTVGQGPQDLGFKGTQGNVPQPITPSGQTATPTPTYAQTENLGPTGAVSSAPVGAGSVPVQGTSQASALIKQYMSNPTMVGTGTTPEEIAQGLGLDFASADQQYQQYANSFQQAWKRFKPGTANDTFSGGQQQPMSEAEFIQGLAQSAYGQWGPLIGMLAYEWQEQNGTAMPQALAQQIVAGLKKIPPNDAAQLQTQMLNSIEQISQASAKASAQGGQATQLNLDVEISSFMTQLATYAPSVYSGGSTASGGGGLAAASPSSVIGQYIAANPITSGEAAAVQGSEKKAAIDFLTAQQMPPTPANITALSNPQTLANMEAYVSWMQGVGMRITPAVLTTLMTMPFGAPSSSTTPPAGTGGAYLMGQKVPGSSLNYGAYSAAQGMIGSQWEQYFGRAPTMTELQWSIGQTPQDIQNFIYNSPSKVSGLTIGKYQDYSNEIQNVQGDLPVTASDDFMSSLHQAVTKK